MEATAENGEIAKRCMLAVDVSGSVGGCKWYYDLLENLIAKLKKKYQKIDVIAWSEKAQHMSLEKFNKTYIYPKRGDMGTFPSCFVSQLQPAGDQTAYDLIITTDGEIDQNETEKYVQKMTQFLRNEEVKPKYTQVYFFGKASCMNTNLVHAFNKYQIFINNVQQAQIEKLSDKLYDVKDDPLYKDFQLENMQQLAENVIKEYSLLNKSDNVVKTFRGYVEKIDRKFLNVIGNSINFSKDEFARLLEDIEKNHEKLCQIYKSLVNVQRNDERKWINRLYNLFNVGNFKISLFTTDTAAIDWSDYDRLSGTKVVVEENTKAEVEEEVEEEDLNKYCPILFQESDHFVLVFQAPQNADELLIDAQRKSCADLRSAFSRCPIKMFEYVDYEKLNQLAIPDNISAEAFSSMAGPMPTFKSQYNTTAYGFVLYNFTDPSGITAPKTDMDDAILQHNALALNHLLYADSKVVGSKGLHIIAFLYAILRTKRLEENSRVLVRTRLSNTIQRIAHLYECNLPIFSGIPPNLRIKIVDSFKCATLVVSNIYKNGNNVVRMLGFSSEIFVEMMKKIFGYEYKHNYDMAKWNYWKWMLDYLQSEGSRKKHLARLWAITNTKQQNWRTLSDGSVMLLEGKNHGKSFNRYLDVLSVEDAFKLFEILQSNSSPLLLQDLEGKIDYQVPEVVECIESGDGPDHVRICTSTCRPTMNCPVTGKPWLECVPESIQTRYDLSFFAHFYHYVAKHKKIPTIKKLGQFINKKYPRTVYYKDISDTLGKIIAIFRNFLESNSISVEEYLKRCGNSCDKVKRAKMEKNCQCEVHNK